MSAEDSDLKGQREKFDQYRQWMKQQQKTLETTGASTAEIARRIAEEQQGGGSGGDGGSSSENQSAYMRRNLRRSHSPNAAGRGSPLGGGGAGGGFASASPGRSPGDKPPWINTKVGSTNKKSEIPPEQLAKFSPPPPPSDDGGYNNDPLNVFSRSQLWQKRKQQKVTEARDLKDQVLDMECTFHPQTHASEFLSESRSESRSAPRTDHGGYRVCGVDEFIDRQHKARDEAAYKESRLKTKPQFAWRNQTTSCDPFDLGRRRQKSIRSLKQPFTAAPGAVASAMRGADVSRANDVFAPLAEVLPKGVFSGTTSAEIVDCAVLRQAGSPMHRR